jgi:hypothetical protein
MRIKRVREVDVFTGSWKLGGHGSCASAEISSCRITRRTGSLKFSVCLSQQFSVSFVFTGQSCVYSRACANATTPKTDLVILFLGLDGKLRFSNLWEEFRLPSHSNTASPKCFKHSDSLFCLIFLNRDKRYTVSVWYPYKSIKHPI